MQTVRRHSCGKLSTILISVFLLLNLLTGCTTTHHIFTVNNGDRVQIALAEEAEEMKLQYKKHSFSIISESGTVIITGSFVTETEFWELFQNMQDQNGFEQVFISDMPAFHYTTTNDDGQETEQYFMLATHSSGIVMESTVDVETTAKVFEAVDIQTEEHGITEDTYSVEVEQMRSDEH